MAGLVPAIETRLLKMIITARHTPVSILWNALGYDAASRLPGLMGNMMVHPGQIARVEDEMRVAYSGTTPDAL